MLLNVVEALRSIAVLRSSCGMLWGVTELLLDITEHYESAAYRFGTLWEHYRAVTECYGTVMETIDFAHQQSNFAHH